MTVPSGKQLRIEEIAPSKQNPRKDFDQAKLVELAESIRTHGVLQPILVRPAVTNGKPYEIVAGERRWRAAQLAEQTRIPAVVRAFTDQEALEVQVIENLQRDDLHPLEEAEGYRLLTTKHGYDVDTLAAKVGKSRKYVYDRMKLLALAKPAAAALRAGQLSPSVALLIARIPTAKLQVEATRGILTPRFHDGEPLTYRQAKEWLERDFMVRLKAAPFDTKDSTLVRKAGACTSCPKRTGNEPDLFPDIQSADVCTDPPCFRKKRDAAWQRLKIEAKAGGRKTVEGKAAEHVLYGNDHVELTANCWQDSRNRTWGALLRKCMPEEQILARDRQGAIRTFVKKAAALSALKAAGHKFASEDTRRAGRSTAEARKEDRRRKVGKAAGERAVALVTAKLDRTKPTLKRRRLLVELLIDDAREDACTRVGQALDLTPGRGKWGGKDYEKPLKAHAATLDDAGLLALALRLLISNEPWHPYRGGGFGSELAAAAAHCGVDLKTVKRQAEKDVPRRKPTTKKKLARKKAAKRRKK